MNDIVKFLYVHNDSGLYVAPAKCKFHKESVEYLGFIISTDGLRMAQDKVQIILDWPKTQQVKAILHSSLTF